MKICWRGTLLVAAMLLMFGAPRRGAAHTGEMAFLDHLYDSHVKNSLSPGATKATTDTAVVREMGSLFGLVQTKTGRTLLPTGTTCDFAEIADGKLTVGFTFPASLKAGDLTEVNLENVGAVLTHYFVNLYGVYEVKAVGRFATAKMDAGFVGMEKLVTPAPALPPETKAADGVPGPEYQKLYRQLQSQAAAEPGKAFAGQGPISTSGQPAGVLSGRTVFFGAGHGWTCNDTGNGGDGSWFTQRPFLLSMCEDYGNIDQVNFFATLLFNAGATVVCSRPLGYQTNEVVLDNEDSAVTYTPAKASWTLSGTDTDNYGDSSSNNMRYISTAASETATATYTPNIPEAGFYPVYCFANASSNRTSGQLYKVRHTGGETQVRINHRRVGRGWIWLGNYYFNAGSNSGTGSVQISNLEPPAGTAGYVIADAIRFGNGMGSITRGGGVSGYAREAECSRYWLQQSEMPNTVIDASSTDQNDNVSAPPRMAAYMRQDDGQGYNGDIYLGYHSNAFNGSARGSVGLITNAASVTNQATLAALVSDTLDTECNIEDANWEYTWGAYGSSTLTSAYGEIGTGLNSEMCGTIIEIAFHDNSSDAALLRDPKVRYVAARSQMHALVKYFNQFDSNSLAFPPEPPTRVRAVNSGSGGVTISWAAVAAGSASTDAATGYRIYRSTDGYGFGNPVSVSGNGTVTTTINGLTLNQVHYFRVAATNAAGESTPSEVVAVRLRNGPVPVLIVNGYDRIDRYNNVPDFPNNASGSEVERLRLQRNNSYDYVRQHGTAVANAGRWFDSCANECVINNDVNLANYSTVIWISGEESSGDSTFNSTERTAITNFLALSDRNLFVSGSEIAYDLDSLGNAQTFYRNTLRAQYVSDSASAYQATGVTGSILAGISADFSPGTTMYDVESADVLSAVNGSSAAMSYPSSSGTVDNLDAIGTWQDPNYSGQTTANATSTFAIVSSPTHQGTGSGDLYYDWGAGTRIREFNNTVNTFPSNSIFSVWVYGDNSGNTLRVMLRDTADTELFQSSPVTLNFTGWQQITWNIPSDASTEFTGAGGDGVITGPNMRFDSMLLDRNGGPATGNLYFDDATYTGLGGSSTAAVQYSGTYKLVTFGFPFEAIASATTRDQVMSAILNFFGTPLPVGIADWQLE
ncbi:MAG: fibronectin type III domain-containing protein [Candidatus Sumerlaeaceae bacterium]|nr:fibronectin type III domain-containing protein [Candidatus Sumerlaeaceae bacterium]